MNQIYCNKCETWVDSNSIEDNKCSNCGNTLKEESKESNIHDEIYFIKHNRYCENCNISIEINDLDCGKYCPNCGIDLLF